MKCTYKTFVWEVMIFSIIIREESSKAYREEIRLNDMNCGIHEGLDELVKRFPNISLHDVYSKAKDHAKQQNSKKWNLLVDISKIGTETVHLLKPRGFNISIKAVPHVRQILFHGRVNERFGNEDAGTIYPQNVACEMDKRHRLEDNQTQLYFEYENLTTVLNSGDTMYYWINAIYQNTTVFVKVLSSERSLAIYPDGTLFRRGYTTSELRIAGSKA